MNKVIQATGIALILTGCSGGYDSSQDTEVTSSADGTGPFYECFDAGYYEPVEMPEVAYQKGECFMNLAQGDKLLGQSFFNETKVGADQHTLMQYADSWYAFAAEKGHALAAFSLDQNHMALYAYENHLVARDRAKQELFAYESRFSLLDLDNNGSLSFEEAQADRNLAQSFAVSDIDEDGAINIGEYIVSSSEATAAGIERPMLSY